MTPAVGNGEFDRLKMLLFRQEREHLTSLQADIASLQQYVGNAARLEQATAEILIGAFRNAEIERPRELAAAVAPLILSSIRSEIRNSRDLMVDALYPITGRLVRAAVANAFKEMIAVVERRIGAMTSVDLWISQVRSLLTGRPVSEHIVAESSRPKVLRLMVIERGSGRLVADWRPSDAPIERADLLSAMIAAIMEFSVQALAGEGTLQALDFGGREIVLRSSPRTILAAEFAGVMRPADDAKISSLFFDLVENIDQGKPSGRAALAALASAVELSLGRRASSRRGRMVLIGLLALCGLGTVWLGTFFAQRMMIERRTTAEFIRLAANEPTLTGFPLRLKFDHQSGSVFVSGIAPDRTSLDPVIKGLAAVAAPYQVVTQIGDLRRLQEFAAQRSLSDLLHKSAAIEMEFSNLRERLAGEERTREQQVTELRSAVSGPVERLERFIRSTAIFFSNGEEFFDHARAVRDARDLAEILAGNELTVRIVGHADETGSAAGNKELGRRRAEKVVELLKSMGVDPARLAVVSRSSSVPIMDQAGAMLGGNRRVTFENVFRDEMRR